MQMTEKDMVFPEDLKAFYQKKKRFSTQQGVNPAIKDLWTFTVRYHMEIPKVRNVVKHQKVKSLIA